MQLLSIYKKTYPLHTRSWEADWSLWVCQRTEQAAGCEGEGAGRGLQEGWHGAGWCDRQGPGCREGQGPGADCQGQSSGHCGCHLCKWTDSLTHHLLCVVSGQFRVSVIWLGQEPVYFTVHLVFSDPLPSVSRVKLEPKRKMLQYKVFLLCYAPPLEWVCLCICFILHYNIIMIILQYRIMWGT